MFHCTRQRRNRLGTSRGESTSLHDRKNASAATRGNKSCILRPRERAAATRARRACTALRSRCHTTTRAARRPSARRLAVALALAAGAAALRPAAATRARPHGRRAPQPADGQVRPGPGRPRQGRGPAARQDPGSRLHRRRLPAAGAARSTPRVKQGVDRLPKWTYDGSSTGQAPGDDRVASCRARLDPSAAATTSCSERATRR